MSQVWGSLVKWPTGTGKLGDPHDLAGLVCNKLGDHTCINPCKGSDSGDTWKKRHDDLMGWTERYWETD